MIKQWAVFVVGLALIISPWILGFSDISLAKWCNVLMGLVLALASAWAIFGKPPETMPTAAVTDRLQPASLKKKAKHS